MDEPLGPKDHVVLNRNVVEVKNLRFFGREVYPEPFDKLRTGRAEGLPQNDIALMVVEYNTYSCRPIMGESWACPELAVGIRA